jgi:hypothetical protein
MGRIVTLLPSEGSGRFKLFKYLTTPVPRHLLGAGTGIGRAAFAAPFYPFTDDLVVGVQVAW